MTELTVILVTLILYGLYRRVARILYQEDHRE